MDREGRQTEAGRSDSNVVPFPRDWLGPRDELVPLGTVESDPTDSATLPRQSTTAEAGGAAPSATDFWSGTLAPGSADDTQPDVDQPLVDPRAWPVDRGGWLGDLPRRSGRRLRAAASRLGSALRPVALLAWAVASRARSNSGRLATLAAVGATTVITVLLVSISSTPQVSQRTGGPLAALASRLALNLDLGRVGRASPRASAAAATAHRDKSRRHTISHQRRAPSPTRHVTSAPPTATTSTTYNPLPSTTSSSGAASYQPAATTANASTSGSPPPTASGANGVLGPIQSPNG